MMVKWKLHPGQNKCFMLQTQFQLSASICTASMLTLSYSDVKAERMLTPVQQPEPELQQVKNTMMSSQAGSFVALMSIHTCFYSTITVVITLKSLRAGFSNLHCVASFLLIHKH